MQKRDPDWNPDFSLQFIHSCRLLIVPLYLNWVLITALFASCLKVDGLCYLLQEIYGIENKINQKTGKVGSKVIFELLVLLFPLECNF